MRFTVTFFCGNPGATAVTAAPPPLPAPAPAPAPTEGSFIAAEPFGFLAPLLPPLPPTSPPAPTAPPAPALAPPEAPEGSAVSSLAAQRARAAFHVLSEQYLVGGLGRGRTDRRGREIREWVEVWLWRSESEGPVRG